MKEKGFNDKHRGSNFDDFLKEEGILDHCEAVVAKRRFSSQVEELMKKKKISKTSLAKEMKTSRAVVNRLLDPDNISVTLLTMEKAAVALGKKLRLTLTD